MKECKYRGKTKDEKTWIYGTYYKHQKVTLCPIGLTEQDTKDNELHLIIKGGFSDWNLPANLECYEVIPETIGEYTGLHDGKHSDGKEICQGDICKDNKGDIVAVEWNDENFCFSCRIVKGGTLTEGLRFPLWQYNNCQMNGYRYLEIIGNTTDNPELLEY